SPHRARQGSLSSFLTPRRGAISKVGVSGLGPIQHYLHARAPPTGSPQLFGGAVRPRSPLLGRPGAVFPCSRDTRAQGHVRFATAERGEPRVGCALRSRPPIRRAVDGRRLPATRDRFAARARAGRAAPWGCAPWPAAP